MYDKDFLYVAYYLIITKYLKKLIEISFDVFCVRAVSHPSYPSVLQALEIEDPVVANCLIDQKGIESILLIKVKHNFFSTQDAWW